ncbi:MAG: PDZ domain-containing protein [Verrucomicrobiota bacterium]
MVLTATAPAAPEGIEEVFPTVVRIEAVRLRPDQGRLQKARVGGSGAIISTQGHVITNYHVAQDADFYQCHFTDGSKLEARHVGQDALTDIAVIQFDVAKRPAGAGPLPVARFGDSEQVKRGDEVFALGSPASISQSLTRGVVANPALVLPDTIRMILDGENVGEAVRWILHDASIFGGNSGGPLVNARGEIIGINEMGVANLGGAIPGNLARAVADQLIRHGKVTRGWSGLTAQPRLEADGPAPGVLIADVAADSPAAQAGLLPGDIVLKADGHLIEGTRENSVASFIRLEMGRLPGEDFVVDYTRAGQAGTARLTLAGREPAQAEEVEMPEWGAVLRDITRQLAREERLPDQRGAWLDNIRPGGPAGQGEPELRRQDVILTVDGEPVADVAGLQALTNRLLPDAPNATRTVLVGFRRNGADYNSVVELRRANPRNVTPQARKAWLGVASQPLTPRLAARLGLKADGGARLTQIYSGTSAESAGLLVGDVIVALDGAPVAARRAEDADVLARMIRQYRAGSTAIITLWRDGQKLDVNVSLPEQPTPPAEMAFWEDVELEFAAREPAFDDRVRLQLPAGIQGVLVESVVPSGWAALAGLRGDDLILQADGMPVTTVAALKAAREAAVQAGREWWVLLVHRRGRTLFVELKRQPLVQ